MVLQSQAFIRLPPSPFPDQNPNPHANCALPTDSPSCLRKFFHTNLEKPLFMLSLFKWKASLTGRPITNNLSQLGIYLKICNQDTEIPWKEKSQGYAPIPAGGCLPFLGRAHVQNGERYIVLETLWTFCPTYWLPVTVHSSYPGGLYPSMPGSTCSWRNTEKSCHRALCLLSTPGPGSCDHSSISLSLDLVTLDLFFQKS